MTSLFMSELETLALTEKTLFITVVVLATHFNNQMSELETLVLPEKHFFLL